jgi:hypothetical protein
MQLVDLAMLRHRLFDQMFKSTSTMNKETEIQAAEQAGNEDYTGFFKSDKKIAWHAMYSEEHLRH